MRTIKVLGLFVIFVFTLLFFSTTRTYAGAGAFSVAIIQCTGQPSLVVSADITDPGIPCDTSGGLSTCDVGDLCASCLSDCLAEQYRSVAQSGGTETGPKNKPTNVVTYTMLILP